MAAPPDESDILQQLKATDCHFNWDLENVGEWMTKPQTYLQKSIHQYNKPETRPLNKKFCTSLHIFYLMHKSNMDGELLMLENAERALNLIAGVHGPPPAEKLPSPDSHLYKCSAEEFFTECCTIDDEQLENAEDESQDDEVVDDCVLDDLADRLVGATHVLRALQAHVMRERGAPVEEIARTLSDIVPVDRMDIRQRGYLREMHASLLYRLDDDGDFCAIVEMLRLALDQDPDDWLVASRYISLVGKKRRCERRFETTLSDVEEIAQILQRFKDVDMPVLFSTNLKFYELEVLYEYLQSSKGPVPRHLTDYKDDLCEELLQVVKGGKLAQCAFIYSRNPKNRRQACEFAELALTQTESTYALAKAANVFRLANKLERALECATRASEEAIGSCWQVLELKVALGHSFDAEQFFQDLFKRFPKESLEIHLNAFKYYVSNTDDFSTALGHYLEILERTGGGELPARLEHSYWAWSRKRDCNTVELAYRIARYFLDEDRGQQLSEEGLASGRVIVSIVDSMPDVKSRFSATRSDNLDAIIYQLSGYSRKTAEPPKGRPQMNSWWYSKNRYQVDNTNWRKK